LAGKQAVEREFNCNKFFFDGLFFVVVCKACTAKKRRDGADNDVI
jgi:hypothetical protein